MIKKLEDIKYFIFILFLICIPLFMKKVQLYIFLSFIINITIISCIIYIDFIRVNFVNKTMFKNITLVNLNLICGICLNLSGINFVFFHVNLKYFILIYLIQCILDFSQLEIILNLYTKPAKLMMKNIVSAVMIAIMLIMNKLSVEPAAVMYLNIIFIVLLIAVIVIMSSVKNITNARNNFNYICYKKMKIYMTASVGNIIGIFFLAINLKYITELCLIFNYVTKMDLYDFLLHKNLNDSLNFIKKDIEKAGLEKKNLNRMLIKRNYLLNEKNRMIKDNKYRYRKLIDSVYDGVYVFIDDKIAYSNYFLEGDNSEEKSVIGMSIELFFREHLGLDYNNYDYLENNTKKVFPIFNRNGCRYEVYLICDDGPYKILYIHDITYVDENIELKKKLERYKKDDQRKREFFSNISHELKTPINSIYSAIQLNDAYLKEDKLNLFERNRNIIIKNCLRLIRTINNFIDANKISEGYITPDIKVYNLVELVENITIGCNKYIKQAGINLIFDADEEEIFIKCDRDMIHRIILNILSNFVKYNEGTTYMKVHVCLKDDKVVIKIKSDGKKIDKDLIPFIFDKFTKINKAYNRLKEGSGLGLFLVKALVELQNGEISLLSKSKGNEFNIVFDRIDDAYHEETLNGFSEMNALEEKIDTEFSDIYY